MKYIKNLLLTVFAVILGTTAVACSSDNGGGSGSEVRFKVDPTTLSFTGDASTQSFTVRATGKPTVTSNADWCTVSYQSDAANVYTYAVSVAENSSDLRSTTVKVVYGTSMKEVVVSQTKKEVVVPEGNMKHSAKELAALIYAGINIGNTMECTDAEGSWNQGGVKVNEAYIRGLKAAGFNAVRIPCAWASHFSDKANYTISADLLDRVYEVVAWCVSNDLYVVLNAHWDGGWLEDNIFDASKEASILAEQKAIWKQVAEKFNAFDEHLLFAASNEPGMNETSGNDAKWKDATAVARVVEYEQAMIDVVRATGGNNANRCLIVQGLGASITNTIDYMTTLPTDAVKDRLMVEDHFYEPYQFCLMEQDADWGKVYYYWGQDNKVSGSDRNTPDASAETWVDTQMAKMKAKYVDQGIPVILGEYSASFRTVGEGEDQSKHDASVAYYGEYVTKVAKNNGCVPFYWETGTVIDRTNGTVKKQTVVDGLMKGAKEGKYPY